MTDTPQITDSHCHLDFPDFEGAAGRRSSRAPPTPGVTRMVTICTRLRHEPAGARHRRGACAGLLRRRHPSDERRGRAAWRRSTSWSRWPRIRNSSASAKPGSTTTTPPKARRCSRRACASISRRRAETGLPLIIHARDADDDMARILTEEHRAGAYACVMHCFSSGRGAGPRGARSGVLPVDVGHRRLPEIAGAARDLRRRPARPDPGRDRRPYLAPPPHRGKRNEPAYTAHTARVGAEVFGLDYADFAARTQANFDRLFAKAAALRGRRLMARAALHHPRLRLVGRRAAAGRPLGRLRPRQPEEHPPPLLAAGRARGPKAAPPRC